MISLNQMQNEQLIRGIESFLNDKCYVLNSHVIAEEVASNIKAFAYELFSQLEGAPQRIGIPYFLNKKAITLRASEWKLLSELFRKCFQIELFPKQQENGFFQTLFSCCSRRTKSTIILPEGVEYRSYTDHGMVTGYVSLYWTEANALIAPFLQPNPLSEERANELYRTRIANSTMPADYSIKVGDTAYPVHSFFLGSFSDHFKALFSRPVCLEGETKEVEIVGFKAKTVKAMIDYSYTGKIPEDLEEVDDLIDLANLAHRYLMTPLSELCTARLSLYTKEHFEKVFIHALELENHMLLTFCLKYCLKETELQIVRQNITKDNFMLLYDLASPLVSKELTLWAKYNNMIIEPEVVAAD